MRVSRAVRRRHLLTLAGTALALVGCGGDEENGGRDGPPREAGQADTSTVAGRSQSPASGRKGGKRPGSGARRRGRGAKPAQESAGRRGRQAERGPRPRPRVTGKPGSRLRALERRARRYRRENPAPDPGPRQPPADAEDFDAEGTIP